MRVGAIEVVVCGLANEVDTESNNGSVEVEGGVPELVHQWQRVPPLVPPLEELPCLPHQFCHASMIVEQKTREDSICQ